MVFRPVHPTKMLNWCALLRVHYDLAFKEKKSLEKWHLTFNHNVFFKIITTMYANIGH